MGTVFKQKNKWYINFTFKGKRYKRVVGRSKKKAMEVLKKIEGDIINEKFSIPVKPRMKFKELAEYWLENYSKVNNAPSQYVKNKERIGKHLIPFFGERKIGDITPRQIDEYKKSRYGLVKAATINRTLAILRKMFNDAIRWEFINDSPMRFIQKLHEPHQGFDYYNENEVRIFLQSCSEDFYPIACCAVYTGMRIGEIIALKWKDIDTEKRIIRIERSTGKTTKSRKVRYVPINSKLLKVLIECRKNGNGDLVFPNKQGGMRSRDLRRQMKKAARMAGLRTIRIHDLRHTFASNYIGKGGNIISLQKILGHSTINMTLRYSHLAPDFMTKDIELLNFDTDASPICPPKEAMK
jgi:integrase